MNGFVNNIEELALNNSDFRRVIYTTHNSQLVLMSIPAGSDIGLEVHDVDQFLRVEAGKGQAILNDIPHDIKDGSAIVVPTGTKHNIVNTGSSDMKLYTLYTPPHHKDGTVHKTKADAEGSEEHFDGQTTEG